MEQDVIDLNFDHLHQLKRNDFADVRLAALVGITAEEIRTLCESYNLHQVYKRMDICIAEFAADIAYIYSILMRSVNHSLIRIVRKS